MIRTIVLTAAFTLVVALPAMAQQIDVRDLSVEQTTVLQASPARAGGLTFDAWFDRSDATYTIGEAVGLFVRTNEDAYVTALSIGPSGNVMQIFPNSFNPDNAARADATIEIPGPGARAVVTGPLGAELIKIIVTNQPVQVIPESQLGASDPYRPVTAGVEATVRDLQSVAAGQKIAIVNKTFRSVTARAAATDGDEIVIVPSIAPTPPAPALNPLTVAATPGSKSSGPDSRISTSAPASISALIPIIGARNPFSLLLATDKPGYAPTERLDLSVTPGDDCYLTVFAVEPSGQARVAFPNQAHQDTRVTATQTIWVSGGGSQAALEAHGPAGSEQLIVAACAKNSASVTNVTLDFTRLFTAAGDRDTVSRELANAQARDPGAIA